MQIQTSANQEQRKLFHTIFEQIAELARHSQVLAKSMVRMKTKNIELEERIKQLEREVLELMNK